MGWVAGFGRPQPREKRFGLLPVDGVRGAVGGGRNACLIFASKACVWGPYIVPVGKLS